MISLRIDAPERPERPSPVLGCELIDIVPASTMGGPAFHAFLDDLTDKFEVDTGVARFLRHNAQSNANARFVIRQRKMAQ